MNINMKTDNEFHALMRVTKALHNPVLDSLLHNACHDDSIVFISGADIGGEVDIDPTFAANALSIIANQLETVIPLLNVINHAAANANQSLKELAQECEDRLRKEQTNLPNITIPTELMETHVSFNEPGVYVEKDNDNK